MVGRNVIALAKARGYEVDAPDRKSLDLLDSSSVHQYLERSKPDVVLHCAGLVGGIQANIAAPFDFSFVNLQIGMNVIKAACDIGICDLINFGSSCMYPRNAENPLKETLLLTGELEPTNEGYAIAKLATARLTQYANAQSGVRYKTLIPCNLYGYWDKFEPEKSHMIPGVIRKLHEAKQNNLPSIDIWGDGNARREFMFAEDLADFTLFALENMDKIPALMNVGLGIDYSINEYYQAIKEVIEYDGSFYHDLSKPVGMKQKLVDTSFQAQLGWQPKHSLVEGLTKTYQFFQSKVI